MINLHVAYQGNFSNGECRLCDRTIERWPRMPRDIADIYMLKDFLVSRERERGMHTAIIISIIPLGDEYADGASQ